MAQIIPIGFTFSQPKDRPLSKPMIAALQSAYFAQQHGYISSSKVTGSFTILIRRGLIRQERICTRQACSYEWMVTPKSIRLLQAMGFDLHAPTLTWQSY